MVQNRSCNVLYELWHQTGYRFYGKGSGRWNANRCHLCNSRRLQKHFTAGSHGTTFGGHPVCCAAALAEVNELLDRDLAGNAKKVGDYFAAKLEKLPHVKEVRHQGLLVGVEFDDTICRCRCKTWLLRQTYADHSNRKHISSVWFHRLS